MKNIKFIITLFSLLNTSILFSQDGEWITVRDMESWGSLNLNFKVTKKWQFGLEEQFRFSNNSSEIDAYFTELSTKYKFNKHIYGGVGFRFIRQNDNVGKIQGFENHIRLHFDLGFKHSLNRFNFDYRLRYQTKNELGVSKEEGDYANNHLRLRLNIGYNIKKWKLDPEFSSEIFRHYEKEIESSFDKYRLTIGTKYNTKSHGKIGLFYRFEKELNVSYPKTTNILGLKYTYTIK